MLRGIVIPSKSNVRDIPLAGVVQTGPNAIVDFIQFVAAVSARAASTGRKA